MNAPTRSLVLFAVTSLSTVLAGCHRQPAPEPSQPEEHAAAPASFDDELSELPEQAIAVGAQAPTFALHDLDGKRIALADFRGKTVVLEWFNPECPFVRNAHTKGSLADTASRWAYRGVVWIAINSGAEGRQGYGTEVNRAGVAKFGLKHPVLLDPTGQVGRAYGATNTPHMMVLNADGKLVYRGAIDNSPDGERESPEGGTLVAYVEQALSELAAGKPISVAETKAYGCGVKYR